MPKCWGIGPIFTLRLRTWLPFKKSIRPAFLWSSCSISGRPLFIDNVLDSADAVLAAWLPGTQGDGVADVLFGDYKPTGKLSFTWPKSTSTSLHRGDPGYQALFALGYGLSY